MCSKRKWRSLLQRKCLENKNFFYEKSGNYHGIACPGKCGKRVREMVSGTLNFFEKNNCTCWKVKPKFESFVWPRMRAHTHTHWCQFGTVASFSVTTDLNQMSPKSFTYETVLVKLHWLSSKNLQKCNFRRVFARDSSLERDLEHLIMTALKRRVICCLLTHQQVLQVKCKHQFVFVGIWL